MLSLLFALVSTGTWRRGIKHQTQLSKSFVYSKKLFMNRNELMVQYLIYEPMAVDVMVKVSIPYVINILL